MYYLMSKESRNSKIKISKGFKELEELIQATFEKFVDSGIYVEELINNEIFIAMEYDEKPNKAKMLEDYEHNENCIDILPTECDPLASEFVRVCEFAKELLESITDETAAKIIKNKLVNNLVDISYLIF